MPESIKRIDGEVLHPIIIFALLLASVFLTNFMFESFVVKILILSCAGLILSNFIRSWNFEFALKIGSILILIVMAVLGLKLHFSGLVIDLELILFLVVWLVSHFIIMLIAAKLLKVNSAWVPIASMANVGGIATAPGGYSCLQEGMDATCNNISYIKYGDWYLLGYVNNLSIEIFYSVKIAFFLVSYLRP